ncbi:hypothetical protein [Archangium sp. Cb G35]|uniref:hypothetical protein n=1 Tax=Archangium sp. Cb G35 TaxID=1920190 RepID=UPI0009362ED7|nr:hypothetical protein [Archangium sp. Cb G35]
MLPFAAPAANENEIRNYIISINRLYESLDYEFALNQIRLGRQLPRSTDEEVALTLYEGIILCEMGKPSMATSAFRAALLLRPDAKLPVQVAPKVEALFEFVRKQVKQEVASLLPSSGTEKTSNKSEQKREDPLAPPSTSPALEKHGDTRIAQSTKKEGSSSVEPRASTAQVTKTDTKHPPMPSATSVLNAEQKKEAPVAVQPPKSQDCGPKPSSVSSRDQINQQLWRLARMQHALCLSGKFQGVVAESWTKLKARMEDATTSYERTLITKDIDQFASEFIYEDPQREAERQEAERREAERLKAALEAKQREAEIPREAERALIKKKFLDAANLDTSKCQPVVSTDCERELLIQRLNTVYKIFLSTNPPSPQSPVKELLTLVSRVQAARNHEDLQQASQAIDAWQQRRFP